MRTSIQAKTAERCLVTTAAVLIALTLALALAEAKTSRPDGVLLRPHPYRRLLAYITPTRAHATVTFDTVVDAGPLVAWLDQQGPDVHLTHAVVGACFAALCEVPRMNRFVTGRRLYQRRGEWITFSMKRKRLDRDARIAMVKLGLRPGETFRDLCARIDASIGEQRSDAPTHEDREYRLFDALPRPALRLAVGVARWLDEHNLLPGWFIEPDGLYTSIVVANLGSLGMAPAYHHLYEWGNCPLFLAVGAIEDGVAAVDGRVVVRKQLHLRFTYDERIDDGLNAKFGIDAVVRALTDPRSVLGEGALDRSRPVPT
jgi:hypothetical protein